MIENVWERIVSSRLVDKTTPNRMVLSDTVVAPPAGIHAMTVPFRKVWIWSGVKGRFLPFVLEKVSTEEDALLLSRVWHPTKSTQNTSSSSLLLLLLLLLFLLLIFLKVRDNPFAKAKRASSITNAARIPK